MPDYRLTLEFAYKYDDYCDWEVVDTYCTTVSFLEEAEARAMYREAKTLLKQSGWDGDDEDAEPTKAQQAFIAKHKIVMFDDDGAPTGWPLILVGVREFLEVTDLTRA